MIKFAHPPINRHAHTYRALHPVYSIWKFSNEKNNIRPSNHESTSVIHFIEVNLFSTTAHFNFQFFSCVQYWFFFHFFKKNLNFEKKFSFFFHFSNYFLTFFEKKFLLIFQNFSENIKNFHFNLFLKKVFFLNFFWIKKILFFFFFFFENFLFFFLFFITLCFWHFHVFLNFFSHVIGVVASKR